MEIIHNILEAVILTISGLGTAVVVWGVLEAMVAFIGLKFSSSKEDAVSRSESIRQRLGAHLLLGLEIFIAADIISSAVSPSWEKVGMLAAIVGVRTVLSYFLRMELKHGMS
ncbi:MAG TPA: DUF1622 domain-containing protein [Thermodesulfovibrionales bacterium]|nr:DUF1622 domain-containing protein [Thermodesulfovibrionales bacterium]